MPRNPEDIPITSASLRLRGDVYSSISDSAPVRFIDPTGQRVTISTESDAGSTAVNPLTGLVDPAGYGVGSADVIANYARYGIYNASFEAPPADTTVPIDEFNPLPYWQIGGTATGATDAVQWTWMLDSSYGAALKVSGQGLQVNDDVYIEQIVPARALYADTDDYWARVLSVSATAPNAATFSAYLSITFFDINGNTASNTGNREVTVAGNTLVSAGATGSELLTTLSFVTRSWVTDYRKAYARIRFGVRTTALVSSAWGVEFIGPRLYRSDNRLLVTVPNAVVGNSTLISYDSTLNVMATYNSSNTRIGLIGAQLTPIPFSTVNIAAGATTAMQLWGDTALALATPRIEMPYNGYIVAISWRLSAAITGGQITAVRAVTQAGTIIRNFGTLDATSGQTGNIKASSLGGGYNQDAFSQGDNLGIDLVTGGGLLPAGTLDMAVILWVAFTWSGN